MVALLKAILFKHLDYGFGFLILWWGGELHHLTKWVDTKLKRIDNVGKIVLSIIIWGILIAYANVIEKIQGNLFAEYIYDDLITYLGVVIIFILINCLELKGFYKGISCITAVSQLTLGIYIIHPTVIKIGEHFPIVASQPIVLFLFSLIGSAFFAYFINKMPILRKISF